MFAPLAAASGLSSSATISSATSIGVRPGRSSGLAAAQHLGVDRARAQADRADAEPLALDRDRLGEPDDAVLGDVVGGKSRELLRRVDARQRSDVDDPPFAGGAHRGEGGAAAEERPGQVDRKRVLPELRGRFRKRRRRQHARRRRRARRAARSPRWRQTGAATSSTLLTSVAQRRRLATRLADPLRRRALAPRRRVRRGRRARRPRRSPPRWRRRSRGWRR